MSRRLEGRLRKLEASNAERKTFVIWKEPDIDVAAETERLKRERGLTEDDRLVVLAWLEVASVNVV